MATGILRDRDPGSKTVNPLGGILERVFEGGLRPAQPHEQGVVDLHFETAMRREIALEARERRDRGARARSAISASPFLPFPKGRQLEARSPQIGINREIGPVGPD